MIELRPYQTECLDAIAREHATVRSTLIVLATGLGKTTIFADWIARRRQQLGGRALVVAHRQELVQQAADRIRLQTGASVGIEMADSTADSLIPQDVIVASVQTLAQRKRLQKFDRWEFTSVVIDEAHHSTAAGYRAILDHFSASQVLGVTATPDRLDGIALGGIFDSCAYRMEMQAGIAGGFLVPIIAKRVVVESLDLSKVKSRNGDLSEHDLQQAMTVDKVLHEIAGPLVREAGTRSTIVFTPGVEFAHALVDVLPGYTASKARAIDGTTPRDERRRTLEAFARGDVQFVVNHGVLTEGFDAPLTACIAMARPTKSRALFAQCVGRGTRPAPGKTDLLVLDFTGNAGRHVLVSPLDVLGGEELPEVVKKRAQELVDEGQSLDVARQQAEEEEWERSAFERLEAEDEERRRKARITAEARYSASIVDPFGVLGVEARKGDEGGPRLTGGQRSALERFGVELGNVSRRQASKMLEELGNRARQGLATWKQARWCAKNGYPTNLSRADASRVMDAWASNGWRRPAADPLAQGAAA